MGESSRFTDAPGTLNRHADFASRFVEPRHVDVWLPPGCAAEEGRRFPVIYMHDGQNLFDPTLAYTGVDWGLDEVIVHLAGGGKIAEVIVVGIWNTPRRKQEYMPQKPAEGPEGHRVRAQLAEEYGGEPLSDRYLRFLVEEVKPFVDAMYRTLPERESTFIMGSSMGGLISLYALCEYPEVFAAAGCLSTHWPAGEGVMVEYLRRALPRPGKHRVYFDHGTETLDATYEAYQRRVDKLMRAARYREGVDWITRKFPGAEHTERAWQERVHIPLQFLLTQQRIRE